MAVDYYLLILYVFLLREAALHVIESPYILPTQHFMYYALI